MLKELRAKQSLSSAVRVGRIRIRTRSGVNDEESKSGRLKTVLRDKNLIPLSHQHQHALALCVRLDRALQAKDVDLEAWQSEIQAIFEQEIGIHFAAEEKIIFPPARRLPELQSLIEELLAEHAVLRDFFARASARSLNHADLQMFAARLSQHIRKEERELFEALQRSMTVQQLSALGTDLNEALKDVTKACALPRPATPLPGVQR